MEPLCSSVLFILLLTYMALPTAAQSNPVSALPSPTSVPGDTNYELLGCYNELPPSTSGIALGATGTYMSPIFASDNALTVPLCLEGRGVATAPNGSGRYIYAAVENNLRCYCGFTLSPSSHPVPSSNCNLPCAADPTILCGGNGFLTLYKSRSTSTSPTNTTLSTTALPTPTDTTIPTSPRKYTLNMTPIWIGISLSLAALALLVFFLLHLESRLHASRKRSELISSIPPRSLIGGHKLHQQNQDQNQRKSIKGKGKDNRLSRNPFHDGRRFGVVGLGVDGEIGVERLWDRAMVIQSEEEGKRNRDMFEVWKRGVVPPLKPELEGESYGWQLEDRGRQRGSGLSFEGGLEDDGIREGGDEVVELEHSGAGGEGERGEDANDPPGMGHPSLV